jgi:Rps23 Pro-64 3,4-dihydroxylase Tpa1-like proline 4-hydroxylase
MKTRLSKKYQTDHLVESVRHSHPWPHFVLDGLIEAQDFLDIQKVISENQFEYQTEAGDPAELQFRLLPDLALAEFFLSPQFRSILEQLTGSKLSLNKKGAIQLRRMTPESPEFRPHHDSSGSASWAMLFYLAPHWNPQCGGELILHREQDSCPMGSHSKWIEPLANRLVIFKTTETNWHSVRRVQGWNRYVIVAEWLII